MKPFQLLFFLTLIVLTGCDSQEEEEAGASNDFTGVWTRLPGPSGDRTDIAIGNIEGEPDDRVYMCEKEGSTVAGFYKGTLIDNVIVWDDNLPPTYLRIVDGQLEFDYDCCGTIPTYYERGSWGGECGPLENSGSIYMIITEEAQCADSNCFTDNNPGVPDNAQFNVAYGPLNPGVYTATFCMGGSTITKPTLSYELERPPVGVTRTYTLKLQEFSTSLNRCVWISPEFDSSALTYVDN